MTRSRFARLVPVLVLVPALALGAAAPAGAAGTKTEDDPAETTAGSAKYREACKDGNTRYAAHDFVGAIAAYQKAVEMDPNNALGHYFLGEAQLAAGNL